MTSDVVSTAKEFMTNQRQEEIDWYNIETMIWMQNGKLVIDSRIKPPECLIACIEDNIVEVDDHEYIQWAGVEKDYKSMKDSQ